MSAKFCSSSTMARSTTRFGAKLSSWRAADASQKRIYASRRLSSTAAMTSLTVERSASTRFDRFQAKRATSPTIFAQKSARQVGGTIAIVEVCAQFLGRNRKNGCPRQSEGDGARLDTRFRSRLSRRPTLVRIRASAASIRPLDAARKRRECR